MECLPSDIAVDILSRLPVDSVWDCKLVSKNWLNLLNHQWDEFAKTHRRRQLFSSRGDASSSTGLLVSFIKKRGKDGTGIRFYYGDEYNNEMNIHEKFPYKTLKNTSASYPLMTGLNDVVGSCNGLVCLKTLNRYHHGIPDTHTIHICNPNTGEYVNLPEYTLREKLYSAAYGFGYVHSIDQYKVVRIINYLISDEKGEVEVYTIGGGSGWRTIGTTSYQLCTGSPFGIFVNGALHWIDGDKIVAFNLGDEEFRLIQSPPCYHRLNSWFYRLQSLRGNLCYCHQRNEERLLDIWSLKKNATEESWSRDFSITCNSTYPLRPLLLTKKNEVLFVHQGDILYCYDPKTNKVIKLWNEDELTEIIAVPHVNSLVSLKALGERCGSLEDAEY